MSVNSLIGFVPFHLNNIVSSEGRCCSCSESSDSSDEFSSPREGDIESKWTGLSAVIDADLSNALFDADNVSNLISIFLNAKERGIVENNSCNSCCSIDLYIALTA